MVNCFFVTDLHGKTDRYEKLFNLISKEKPNAVFFGGDLLPHAMLITDEYEDFTTDYLFPQLHRLKSNLKTDYPDIFLILGNDDPAIEEEKFLEAERADLFFYMNNRKLMLKEFTVYGYSYIPPTPFSLKDWEKYDISRYADPGCTHPTEGYRSVKPAKNIEYETIQKDLESLTENTNLSKAIFLFHSPPHKTNLDRAALDGKLIDYVPLDLHVGSIAIKRFIDELQPYLTMHGHVHESTQLTGHWMQRFQKTISFNAAHNGPELSLIKFNLEKPENAKRYLY